MYMLSDYQYTAEFAGGKHVADMARRSTKSLLELVNSRKVSGSARAAAIRIINQRKGMMAGASTGQIQQAAKGVVSELKSLPRSGLLSNQTPLNRLLYGIQSRIPGTVANRREWLSKSLRELNSRIPQDANDVRSVIQAKRYQPKFMPDTQNYTDVRFTPDRAVSNSGYVGFPRNPIDSKYGGMMEEEVPLISTNIGQRSRSFSRKRKSGESGTFGGRYYTDRG